MKLLSLMVGVLMISGCAHLHHVEISSLDNRPSAKGTKQFDVKLSATGVDVREAAEYAKLLSNSRSVDRAANTAGDVWQAITYGPTTGEVTFSDDYADGLAQRITEQCGRGTIRSIVTFRETAKYPVISGEIIRAIGTCEIMN